MAVDLNRLGILACREQQDGDWEEEVLELLRGEGLYDVWKLASESDYYHGVSDGRYF